jgi:hypothetical protein
MPNTFIFSRIDSTLNMEATDRLCGLVVCVPGYRAKGPGSIPGITRTSEK